MLTISLFAQKRVFDLYNKMNLRELEFRPQKGTGANKGKTYDPEIALIQLAGEGKIKLKWKGKDYDTVKDWVDGVREAINHHSFPGNFPNISKYVWCGDKKLSEYVAELDTAGCPYT